GGQICGCHDLHFCSLGQIVEVSQYSFRRVHHASRRGPSAPRTRAQEAFNCSALVQDLGPPLATAISSLKDSASRTARSASIFRLMLTPASLRPCMNWLYGIPWLRDAALIRAIQSLRMSRLRARRSRYAYSSAWSRASLAGLNSVRCVMRKPLARFRIFLWRRRDGTLRLTRGISVLLLHIRGSPPQTPGILPRQDEQLAVLTLPARALVPEQVTL